MPFKIKGETKKLRGTLANVSADNPAACLMGGLKQLHSAFRKCRFCMAEDRIMQTRVLLNFSTCKSFLITNSCTYNYIVQRISCSAKDSRATATHCREAEGDLLSDHHAITNGVTRDSIFNRSRYFHVIDGMSPDIMHDILEGKFLIIVIFIHLLV